MTVWLKSVKFVILRKITNKVPHPKIREVVLEHKRASATFFGGEKEH